MLKSSSVLCKACGLGSKTVDDKDPSSGKFIVSLQWGALMKQDDSWSTHKFVGNVFDTYKIFMVDDYGAQYGGEAGAIGVPLSSTRKTDCCNPNEYSTQISGTWPAGATRFMIVPAHSGTPFTLPMGVMTNKFTDKTTGPARTIHESSTTFDVANPEAFMQSVDRFQIMQKSLAASMKDIETEHILVTMIKWLQGETEGRRLAEGSIKVDFKVILPASSTIKFTQATIDVTKLSAAIVKQAATTGLVVEVTKVPTVAAITTKVTGGETVTGAASSMAGSALAALIVAIATMIMA